MSEQKRYCRTCHWGVRNKVDLTDLCIRKVVITAVEGPKIVPLNPYFERSVLGGCGPSGKHWEPQRHRERGLLDERLIP